MQVEEIVLNEKRNVKLSSYVLSESDELDYIGKRPAVLILPGGGYEFCSARGAEPVALQYLACGYQAFVLEYSVKADAAWPNPLEDYEQAMDYIRTNADELNVFKNRIAVIGFSAGGHLAASAATLAENKPDACILVYAVTKGFTVDKYNHDAPDTVSAVDEDTPPCFVVASRNDPVVSIDNSIDFISALAKHDVPFESHLYSLAPHGFSVAKSTVLVPDTKINNRVKQWVPDSIEWLKEIFGDFGSFEL